MDSDAELAALRRRAYGPHADIAEDPEAVERLRVLEQRAIAAPGPPAAPPDTEIRRIGGIRPDATGSGLIPRDRLNPLAGDGPDARAAGPRAATRPPWHTAMVAAVAALTLLVGSAAAAGQQPRIEASAAPSATPIESVAFAFASDPRSSILLRVPVDGGHGHLLDLPDPGSGPRFPTRDALAWTQPLGDYYGWRLWIARDTAGRGCLLILAVTSLGRCASADDQASGALFVSVPYAAIQDSERPAGMTSDQSIGFWWIPDDTIIVLTGRTVDAAPQ